MIAVLIYFLATYGFFYRLMLKSLGLWKVSTYSTGSESSSDSDISGLESYKTDEGTMLDGAKDVDKSNNKEDTTVALVSDGSVVPFEPTKSSKMQSKYYIFFLYFLILRLGTSFESLFQDVGWVHFDHIRN